MTFAVCDQHGLVDVALEHRLTVSEAAVHDGAGLLLGGFLHLEGLDLFALLDTGLEELTDSAEDALKKILRRWRSLHGDVTIVGIEDGCAHGLIASRRSSIFRRDKEDSYSILATLDAIAWMTFMACSAIVLQSERSSVE